MAKNKFNMFMHSCILKCNLYTPEYACKVIILICFSPSYVRTYIHIYMFIAIIVPLSMHSLYNFSVVFWCCSKDNEIINIKWLSKSMSVCTYVHLLLHSHIYGTMTLSKLPSIVTYVPCILIFLSTK